MNVHLRRLVRPALLALLLLAAVVSGCTGSDDDATDTSTDTSSDDTTDTSDSSDVTTESTVDGDTTETSETTDTTSTDDGSTQTTSAPSTSSSAASAGAPVPDGSGCTPGSDDTLPDGYWFGYASSREADSFSFDLACWYTGEDATAAASEDGAESPPPNDYHIRNDSPAERFLIPAPDAMVRFLANPGDPATVETIDYPTWVSVAPDRSFEPGVWVEISDGLVVMIDEQYQP